MEMKSDNPKALQTIQLHLKELESVVGKVGWFETAVYPSGRPVAEVAAGNEFGIPSRKIPPRPFMRPAITQNQEQWKQLAATGAAAVLAGKSTAHDVMEKLTLSAQNAISYNIGTLTTPPLAPATLANRRTRGNSSAKPLEDTGLMSATLTSVVENANT